MRDAKGRPVIGRARWTRFVAVAVPGLACAAALVAAMSTGAIAASFAISSQSFKVSADSLEGRGFVQYGGIDVTVREEPVPVAVSAIREATLENLCQSVLTSLPIVGDISLEIHAGTGDRPVTARNIFIDMNQLEGDATFSNIEIGRDASTLDKGPPGGQGFQDAFGQQADVVRIQNLRQVAVATAAATFTLPDLDLSVRRGDHQCF